jgi:hypothetical protein
MELEWKISAKDATRVRNLVKQQKGSPLVQYRMRVNLAKVKAPVSRDTFWRALVGALLTSQQRSGPESSVSRFINTRPHPIETKKKGSGMHYCIFDLPGFVRQPLSQHSECNTLKRPKKLLVANTNIPPTELAWL